MKLHFVMIEIQFAIFQIHGELMLVLLSPLAGMDVF